MVGFGERHLPGSEDTSRKILIIGEYDVDREASDTNIDA